MEGILEFEVKGRRHACTECATGTYEDQAGSTACKSCPWAWSQNMLARTVSAKASTSKDDCQCNKGLTGLAGGLYQDVQDYRPTYVGGNVTGASVFFSRNNSQFLHGPLITSGSTDNIYNRPNDVNLHEPREFRVSSNGGLTIVITVRFMGEIQFGERLVDFGNAKGAVADNLVLGRFQTSSSMIASIAEGASNACEVISEIGTIVQDEWMTIVLAYDARTNTMTMMKEGRMIAGPTSCSKAPSDRNLTRMFVGKSNFEGEAYFNGEMSALYISDQNLRNFSNSCHFNATGQGEMSSCLAQQSSTWTPDAGNQHFRDQRISVVDWSTASAMNAVDASVESCSQTWRQSWPWWRIDLEVPRLVVSVRVHGRTDCCQDELEGFEIRVGNWPTWENNPACASNVPAPDAHQSSVDVMCQAEGRFVFIVIPGTNRSLALCDIEIMGLPVEGTAISGLIPNCTACIPGASVLPNADTRSRNLSLGLMPGAIVFAIGLWLASGGSDS